MNQMLERLLMEVMNKKLFIIKFELKLKIDFYSQKFRKRNAQFQRNRIEPVV